MEDGVVVDRRRAFLVLQIRRVIEEQAKLAAGCDREPLLCAHPVLALESRRARLRTAEIDIDLFAAILAEALTEPPEPGAAQPALPPACLTGYQMHLARVPGGYGWTRCQVCGAPAWEHDGLAVLEYEQDELAVGAGWVKRPWTPAEMEALAIECLRGSAKS